nr:UrcA family protein [Hyphomonas sp. Mor2]
MRKAIATLIIAAALAAPIAQAEGTPITVNISYDSTLLATEEGAKSVYRSIRSQATQACSNTQPATGLFRVDRDCRDDLVDQAIGKIRLAALEDGLQPLYVFAALESDEESSKQ